MIGFFTLMSLISYMVFAGFDCAAADHQIFIDLTNARRETISLPVEVERLPVISVSYDADVFLAADEFAYLVDVHQGELLDAQRILQFAARLQAKSKFGSVIFEFDFQENGVKVAVFLTGFWTFSRLKIQGLLRGKEKYRQFYFLEPGERFCVKKHDHSVAKIKEAFENDGFFGATLDSYFEYDAATKSVVVVLVIDRGYQYIVRDVSLTILGDAAASEGAIHLKERILSLLNSRLLNHYYSKELLTEVTQTIKKYATRRGFIDAVVRVQRQYVSEKYEATLIFDVLLATKRKFFFFGNHFFSKDQLLDLFSSFGNAISVVSDAILQQEITQAYKHKGFLEVAVSPRQSEEGTFFLINEGVRGKITGFEFEGNSLVSTKELCDSVRSSLSSGYVDHEITKEALHNLMQICVRKGLWDAKISEEFIKSSDGAYICKLHISEGQQRWLMDASLDHPCLTLAGMPAMPREGEPVLMLKL